MNNSALICNWINRFRIAGPDALRERRKGRKISMAKLTKKLSNKTTSQTTNDNISKEYVKEIENQLLQIRIENAFLKEVRRLRLVEEAEMKRRSEL
ncbi:transposase [Gemella sanguinis]|uniref:Transposase n=1 Tax=Gemella sanguinis TaxID=84135 RepID=A0A2N6SHD1_9BACL|nr:transposase [Gemella sanguinis]